ncbi:MAG: hypothetical protein M3Q08_05805 [Pseudomonadota bacterium]|nr:hypothetical protein [Pseudomonadota bacterium]
MRNHIIAAARQIRGDVRTTENDYDVALANNARLIAALLDARVKAGLPARTGREAVEHAIEAITHAAKARQLMLQAHEELARLNLRELAVGDLTECPEDWGFGGLTVVASEPQSAAA